MITMVGGKGNAGKTLLHILINHINHITDISVLVLKELLEAIGSSSRKVLLEWRNSWACTSTVLVQLGC